MDFAFLFSGVDTLEATFQGEIPPDLLQQLKDAKALAQARNAPIPFELDGETLYVQEKGQGFYSLTLADSRMRVLVNGSKGGPPAVLIRLRASALASFGHEELYEQAVRVAAALGATHENTLSRLDLFVDLQDFVFTDVDFERLVCAATYRGVHKDGEGLTYQLGRGDVVVRIYRKDAELRARHKEGYAAAWERAAGYVSGRPVFRIELQLRGNVLNELGVRQVRAAFARLAELWVFGMTWCELRVPSADTTKARWPVDMAWQLVRSLWGTSAPAARVRQESALISEERCLARLVGAVATVAAYSGKTDLIEALSAVHRGLEQVLDERGVEFEDLVAEKTARLVSEEGLSL